MWKHVDREEMGDALPLPQSEEKTPSCGEESAIGSYIPLCIHFPQILHIFSTQVKYS